LWSKILRKFSLNFFSPVVFLRRRLSLNNEVNIHSLDKHLKETKMKPRTLYSLTLLAVAVLVVAGYVVMNGGWVTAKSLQAQDTHQHHNSVLSPLNPAVAAQDRPGTVSGQNDPQAIPDHVAFELFLRSLIPNSETDERELRRVKLYARDAGIEEGGEFWLLNAAREFGRQIGELDKQATVIKDRNWPKPSDAAMNQLIQLEARRVALVKSFMESFHTRMGLIPELAVAHSEKVKRYVNEVVKRKVKLTPSELPVK
jgi:hypothetical protein